MAGLLDMLGGGSINPALLRLLAGAPGPVPLLGAPMGPTQQPIGLDTQGTMLPPQVSVPMPDAAPAQAGGGFMPNLLATLMPQTNPLAALLTSPEDVSAARNQGLLDIGTSLLDSAGPHFRYQAPSLGQAVAHGLMAGRQGFQQALGGTAQARMQIPQLEYQLAQMRGLQNARDYLTNNPMPENASPIEQRAYLTHAASIVAPYDPQMATAFSEAAKSAIGPMEAQGQSMTPAQLADFKQRFGTDLPSGADEGQFRKRVAAQITWAVENNLPGVATQLAKQISAGAMPMNVLEEMFRRQGLFNETINTEKGVQEGFLNDIKTYKDKGYAAGQALTAIDAALHGGPNGGPNPAAYASAISKYVQATEQSTNLRFQLLEYYSQNIDPSVKGKFSIMVNKLKSGAIPPAVLDMMRQHVLGLEQNSANQVESVRQDWQSRYPQVQLPRTSTYFPNLYPQTPAAGSDQPQRAPLGGGKKPSLDDLFSNP